MTEPKYALIVHRFQPFSERHLEQVEEAKARGLVPVIVVRSQNNHEHPAYDPIKTPLTLEQQVEDIKRTVPPSSGTVIIPMADLGAKQSWSKALLDKLDDTTFLKKCGLDTPHGIRSETMLMTRPEQHSNDQGETFLLAMPKVAKQLADEGLPTLEYNHEPVHVSAWRSAQLGVDLSADSNLPFCNKDYVLELAQKARAANPDRALLEQHNIPISLFDLTLDRVSKEAGIRTRQIIGMCQNQYGKVDFTGCAQVLDDTLQKQRDLNQMKSVFDFGTEYYDPSGVSLQEYLFHPATLAVVANYGKDALQTLVPQKGFDTFIPAMQTYIDRMRLGMPDKVDYLERIDNAGIIVDFGCADGTMLKYLKQENPERICIGYDISEPMLALARKDAMGVEFSNDWQEVCDKVKQARKANPGKSVLVLSSLIHEIYAYLPPKEREQFWDKVWNSEFDYIAIRDMMVSTKTDRPSDPDVVEKVRKNYDPDRLAEWEQRWGPLENNRSLVHFLLTSPYKENWAREMNEDYLPFNLEDFLGSIPEHYSLKHLDHHKHGYSTQRIRKEFDGAELPDNTHVKMILERRTSPDTASKKLQ
jgi:hypothetical protein